MEWPDVPGCVINLSAVAVVCGEEHQKVCKNKTWISMMLYSTMHKILTQRCPENWMLLYWVTRIHTKLTFATSIAIMILRRRLQYNKTLVTHKHRGYYVYYHEKLGKHVSICVFLSSILAHSPWTTRLVYPQMVIWAFDGKSVLTDRKWGTFQTSFPSNSISLYSYGSWNHELRIAKHICIVSHLVDLLPHWRQKFDSPSGSTLIETTKTTSMEEVSTGVLAIR